MKMVEFLAVAGGERGKREGNRVGFSWSHAAPGLKELSPARKQKATTPLTLAESAFSFDTFSPSKQLFISRRFHK